MSQQFRLIELNQELGLENGFYQNQKDQYRDSLMDEKLENSISFLFSSVKNKSLFSTDLEEALINSQQASLLSSSQFQFLQTFNFDGINTVLDISEDVGGVAHFIADKVGQLESIKIDPAKARLTTNRCANNHNTVHISEDLDKLNFPDKYYDLIILGQVEELHLSKAEFTSLLQKLQASLSSTGILVASIYNSQRVNKWFNSISTSTTTNTTPFADLYYPSNQSQDCQQLSRRELRDIVLNSNFPHTSIQVNFSKANDCQALFSENYLTASVNGVNHFYQLGFIDNQDINEYLLAERLTEEKTNLADLATRFITLASNNKESLADFYDNDFSYYADKKIAHQFQTRCLRPRSSQTVTKEQVHPDIKNASKNKFIRLNLEANAFVKGALLAGEWVNAIFENDSAQFKELALEYSDYVNSKSEAKHFKQCAYNLSPSNIILNARGERGYNIINHKWDIDLELSASFVLFKALLDFAQDNLSILSTYALENDLATIGLFILEHMPSAFQLEDLKPFIKLEEQIQKDIQAHYKIGSIEEFITTVLVPQEAKPDSTKTHQIENNTSENLVITNQAQQLLNYRQNTQHLKQRIVDLQQHRTNVVEKLKDQISLNEQAQAQIDNLHDRLHAQNVRNDELHGYLLMRPTTRAKRVARRTINKLSGKPVIEHASINAEPENTNGSPLPLGELIGQNTEDYSLWISENTLSTSEIEQAKLKIEAMPYKPVFSILVPIYNTDPEYLLPMIESVRNQIYPHWQLCLVDDCSPKTYLKHILEHEALQDERISIQLNDVNQGISVTTNDALAMAKGDYIALLDHDDEISIDALYENAKVINQHYDVGLIYSDEDKMEMDGSRLEPYFKPDFSPDLLHTNNYVCHFTVIKKSIADDIGGFREGLDGSQDHDIILRAAAAAERIVHIPKILYHWRKIPGSTAVEYDSKSYAWEAGRKAVEDQLQKQEDGVRVEFGTLKGTYRVHREIHGEPLVSIIIPFKDKPELLDSCLNSILNRSSYQNIEIIGVSNNSEQDLTFARMQYFSELDSRIRFIEKNIPFNFSAICNYGVEQAKGEYVLLLNNDIEVISPDWIEQMLQNAQRPEVGAVGGKLLYPNGLIQHAGVVAGMVGAAGHPHKFFPDNHIGYHGRLHMAYNVSAVTGAMMMMKTSKFKEVGGFDEENLAVAYNDIDLCLKLLKNGYYNIFTPHAKATHHESISRGYEDTDEKMQRLLKEQGHFLTTWSDFLESGDPFYNPNLSLKNERFSMNFKD